MYPIPGAGYIFGEEVIKVVNKGKRAYPRIPYHGKVDLIFADRELTGCVSRNLCLSGLWVVGCQGCVEGEQCDIYFHNAGFVRSRAMMLKGQVSRIDNDGIAIALIFKDMNIRTYTNLQTMVENYSENSFAEAEKFLDELGEESP